MKKVISFICILTMVFGLLGCATKKEATYEFYLPKAALWYVASDDTSDYTGEIKAYSTSEKSKFDEWIEKSTGSLFISLEDSDEYENLMVLTVTDSQKQDLLDIFNKKYKQAKNAMPSICDFVDSIEDDEKTLTVYYDPDTFIENCTSGKDSLLKTYNLSIFSEFWQLKGNLENGNEYTGNFILKNKNTGYKLYSLNMDPIKSESATYNVECIRYTNYKDYDGTLEFSAKYTGSFQDESIEEAIQTFEVVDDTIYDKGTIIEFRTDELSLQLNVGDVVQVTYPYESSPNQRIYDSHDSALCFDKDATYEMTLKAN